MLWLLFSALGKVMAKSDRSAGDLGTHYSLLASEAGSVLCNQALN